MSLILVIVKWLAAVLLTFAVGTSIFCWRHQHRRTPQFRHRSHTAWWKTAAIAALLAGLMNVTAIVLGAISPVQALCAVVAFFVARVEWYFAKAADAERSLYVAS